MIPAALAFAVAFSTNSVLLANSNCLTDSPLNDYPAVDLNVLTFNAAKLDHSQPRFAQVVKMFRNQKPNVIGVQEVANEDTAERLRDELTSEETPYQVLFFPGQRKRNIHGAVFVNLPEGWSAEKLELNLPRKVQLNDQEVRLFPRGLPVIKISDSKDNVRLVVVNIHLKSKKVHRKNKQYGDNDPNAIRRKQIEEFYNQLQILRSTFGDRLLVMGDFNSDLSGVGDPDGKPEFDLFWQADYRNLLAQHNPSDDLYTHIYRPKSGTIYQQLDGVLAPDLIAAMTTHIEALAMDESLSDHRPIFAKLKLK